MSESSPETPAEQPEKASETTDFEPITSQEQLDKLIGGVHARYKKQLGELKSKADKLDELEDASKSEAQRNAERIAALETELATERQNTLRHNIARDKGVPAHRITGTTKEELEESADNYLAEVAELTKAPRQKSSTGLKSGATNSDSRMDPKERAAAALREWRRS